MIRGLVHLVSSCFQRVVKLPTVSPRSEPELSHLPRSPSWRPDLGSRMTMLVPLAQGRPVIGVPVPGPYP